MSRGGRPIGRETRREESIEALFITLFPSCTFVPLVVSGFACFQHLPVRWNNLQYGGVSMMGVPSGMWSLVLTILLSALMLGDLEQRGDHRLHLSEAAGNLLVKYRVQPRCPDDSCTQCENAEVNLKLVVGKSGTVKQIAVVRAPDSRLAEAARDAVKQWRYERYLLNGSPVEYETYTTIKSWVCGTWFLDWRQ